MQNNTTIKNLIVPLSLLISTTLISTGSIAQEQQKVLTLESTVEMARNNDPWLVGNRYSQDAIESSSIAAGTLPDPKVSMGIANIGTDNFDFGQEAMTQFKVGVSQMFPRGDSLDLRKEQLRLTGSQYPFQREDRKAMVTVTAAKLWLDAYMAQESIALIEKDRTLFEQLADVAQASYSSAVGKTRQQDIIRAQLELTRLDDRLTMLNQKLQMSEQRLSEWLSQYLGGNYSDPSEGGSFEFFDLVFSRTMPNVRMLEEALYTSDRAINSQKLFEYFSNHPSVKALDQKIKASKSGIDLAKQNYKPEWGVNAGYGYRDTAPTGIDRSDLFSVGVSFDIPIFTGNRQDKQVQSAISKSSAVKTEKWLLVRRLIASFETNRSQLVRLNERQKLFQDKLLPQMHDQAEASLTAYTNDDGDFAEVVRARIAELNASIDSLTIDVERQKSIIQLNYFFMKSVDQIITYNVGIAANNRSFGENK